MTPQLTGFVYVLVVIAPIGWAVGNGTSSNQTPTTANAINPNVTTTNMTTPSVITSDVTGTEQESSVSTLVTLIGTARAGSGPTSKPSSASSVAGVAVGVTIPLLVIVVCIVVFILYKRGIIKSDRLESVRVRMLHWMDRDPQQRTPKTKWHDKEPGEKQQDASGASATKSNEDDEDDKDDKDHEDNEEIEEKAQDSVYMEMEGTRESQTSYKLCGVEKSEVAFNSRQRKLASKSEMGHRHGNSNSTTRKTYGGEDNKGFRLDVVDASRSSGGEIYENVIRQGSSSSSSVTDDEGIDSEYVAVEVHSSPQPFKVEFVTQKDKLPDEHNGMEDSKKGSHRNDANNFFSKGSENVDNDDDSDHDDDADNVDLQSDEIYKVPKSNKAIEGALRRGKTHSDDVSGQFHSDVTRNANDYCHDDDNDDDIYKVSTSIPVCSHDNANGDEEYTVPTSTPVPVVPPRPCIAKRPSSKTNQYINMDGSKTHSFIINESETSDDNDDMYQCPSSLPVRTAVERPSRSHGNKIMEELNSDIKGYPNDIDVTEMDEVDDNIYSAPKSNQPIR